MFKYVFWFLLFFNGGFLTGGQLPPLPPASYGHDYYYDYYEIQQGMIDGPVAVPFYKVSVPSRLSVISGIITRWMGTDVGSIFS